jgi:hypothetical protein
MDFSRLTERNNLHETNGQQVTRYAEGLKHVIKDRIGLQLLQNITEVRNMDLRAKLLMQDRK